MTMLKLAWGFAGPWLSKLAQPLLIAAVLGLGVLLMRAGWHNAQLERALSKATAAAAEAEARFNDLVRDYNEQARAADARERAIERASAEALISLRTDYANQMAVRDRTVRLALDGLRYSEAEAHRRALRAREDAPAACRGYAAGGPDLDLRSAEFLVGLADRADRAAVQLAACQQYVRDVVRPPQ